MTARASSSATEIDLAIAIGAKFLYTSSAMQSWKTQRNARVALIVLILLTECSPVAASELRSFASDGCSLFPDGTIKDRAKWCDCCLAHDIAYWRGGTEDERKKADTVLRDCVMERTKDKVLAETMYLGVRAGGHPAFPTWYRWAYGWSYGRGYEPLTEQEQQQVQKKLAEYENKHPERYCKEKHRPVSDGDARRLKPATAGTTTQ